ncbi:MAG: hypothetical protein AAF726_08665 [Planctomycetota bacterium]
MRPLLALALAAALLGSACRTTSVATQNLDATLSSGDTFRYQGRTTSVWRETLDYGFDAVRRVIRAADPDDRMRAIANPTKLALENLIDLEDSSEGRAEWRHGEQVRTFTRYARYAPSQLCRERALLALREHGQRLELTEGHRPNDAAANAPELMEALDGLVDAMRGIVARRGRGDETDLADFRAALEVLRTTPVDIQGGSRLLRALSPFMRSGALPRELRDEVDDLSIEVQRKLIPEAIWAGVRDQSELVRAAAFRSGTAIYGDLFRIEAILALAPPSDIRERVREAYRRFDIPTVAPNLGQVHVAVADDLAENGMPLAARRQTLAGVELRGTIVFVLLRIAASELTFTEPAQHAAMRALGTVSGGELETLRPEEWDDWWQVVGPRLEAEIKALEQPEPGGDAGPPG